MPGLARRCAADQLPGNDMALKIALGLDALLLASLLGIAAPTLAQPAAGSFYVRGSVGVAAQSQKDWNADIQAVESKFQFGLIPPDYYTFGAAIPFGREVGYQVSNAISCSESPFRQQWTVCY